MSRAKTIVATLIVACAVVVGAIAAMVVIGVYNIAATDQHLAPTYRLLDYAMRRSVALRARGIDVPPLDDVARIRIGATRYRTHCVQCHGAPGVAPDRFALGLTPAPSNLAAAARDLHPADVFWTIRHGIKMTAMPAWLFRFSDDEIWDIVAFLHRLPSLSPVEYETLLAGLPVHPQAAATAVGDLPSTLETTGDPDRGRRATTQYLCVTCHEIPGVIGPNAAVGPPLTGMAQRAFIAGVLPNTRANMIRWLRAPQAVEPRGAMPDLGVTERDAIDIAAYLATLR
jgi:mono/diheme cytochrome c family protein